MVYIGFSSLLLQGSPVLGTMDHGGLLYLHNLGHVSEEGSGFS